MAIPAALTEAGGDKLIPLVYDNTGTNAAAAFRGVVPRTVNASQLAYLGVATHPDAGAFAAGDPVVVAGGYDSVGAVVRKIAVDASSRIIVRPQAVYDAGGGVNAFGHPKILARAAQNGEQVGWLAIGSHVDAAAFTASTDPVAVVGGVQSGGTTVRKLAVDSSGRIITTTDRVFTGQGHAQVSTPGTAVQLRSSSTVCRLIQIIADAGNTAAMYFGVVGVTADTNATTGGYQLGAGKQMTIDATNLNIVYVNSTAAGGVSFLYWV